MREGLLHAAALVGAGEWHAAESTYRALLKRDKHAPDALAGLGYVRERAGDLDTAAKSYERAARADPGEPRHRRALARVLLALGDATSLRKARDVARALDDTAESHVLRAEIHAANGNDERAIRAYETALASGETKASVLNNLGLAYRRRGDFGQAITAFRRALEADARNLAAHNNLANALKDAGDFAGALEHFHRALDLHPKRGETLYNLALCLVRAGDAERALRYLQELLESEPDHEPARLQVIDLLITLGRFEQAHAAIDDVLAADPRCARAWYFKASITKTPRGPSDLAGAIESLLADVAGGADVETTILLNFALGKIYDDAGDPARAYACYERANAAKHGTVAYDPASAERLCAEIRSSERRDWVPLPSTAATAEPVLIFVIGMPRSGTTLVERVISNHPDVFGAGELAYFGAALRRLGLDDPRPAAAVLRALSSTDLQTLRAGFLARVRDLAPAAAVVSDKTPENYYYLGLIRRLFPQARIVHCRRHPLDTCLSVYFQLFDGLAYAYDWTDIAAEYLRYVSIMKHWDDMLDHPWFDAFYEALVADPENVARALLRHCGLTWHPGCIADAPAARAISTMSRWQARQPIYRTSTARWRAYEAYLDAPRRALKGAIADYERDLADFRP